MWEFAYGLACRAIRLVVPSTRLLMLACCWLCVLPLTTVHTSRYLWELPETESPAAMVSSLTSSFTSFGGAVSQAALPKVGNRVYQGPGRGHGGVATAFVNNFNGGGTILLRPIQRMLELAPATQNWVPQKLFNRTKAIFQRAAVPHRFPPLNSLQNIATFAWSRLSNNSRGDGVHRLIPGARKGEKGESGQDSNRDGHQATEPITSSSSDGGDEVATVNGQVLSSEQKHDDRRMEADAGVAIQQQRQAHERTDSSRLLDMANELAAEDSSMDAFRLGFMGMKS